MIEIKTVQTLKASLKEFCQWSGDHHYIEVTEWLNGDGVDIKLQDTNGIHEFYLTWGQLNALNACIDKLNENK